MKSSNPQQNNQPLWWRETDHNRHHRENIWDYKGRAIYHITLTTAERCPAFGALDGNCEKEAHITLSDLGKMVNDTIVGLPAFYAQKGIDIRVLASIVMPDHLHMVIHVKEPMPKSIGEVVRSFKSACTSWFKRQYINAQAKMFEECTGTYHSTSDAMAAQFVHFCRIFATTGSVWEHNPAGYHERIFHCAGQLNNMIQYVKDNPRRLWLKRNNPNLFKIHNSLSWTHTDENSTTHTWQFRSLGNQFLLDNPRKQFIQCSRSMTSSEIEQYCNACLHAAQQGVVSITAAISEGEKNIARRLCENAAPLILLLKDGFPPVGSERERYYKPGGKLFDLCSAGHLLLLEPHTSVFDDMLILDCVYRRNPAATRNSLRYHFLALNEIGQRLLNY